MKNQYAYFKSLGLSLFLWVCMMSGVNTLQAQTPCLDPIEPMIISLSATEVTIKWTNPSPAPWNGYDYYLTQSTQVPNSNTTPTGNVSMDNVTLNVQVGNTYRFYVRSVCGTATGTSNGPWQGFLVFTPIATGTGCAQAPFGMSPTTTFVPAYTQSPELINSDAYAGEFCKVDIMANRQYEFTTNRSTDYITITNFSGSVVLAHGVNPVMYNSGTNDFEVRYYISANSMCLSQASERERYVTARLVPSATCPAPSALTTTSISTDSAIANWTNNAPGVITSFQYYYSTNSTPPGINATPNGSTTFSTFTFNSLLPNTTYYWWVRGLCDQDLTQWIAGAAFTTQATAVNGCVSALYGQTPPNVFVPACTGAAEIIASNMWAGNYSLIDIIPNKTYTFTSSVGTDFITIRDNNTSIAYASGTTPLVWSSGSNTARIKMFVHLNAACGSLNVNRTTTITCQNAVASCSTPSGFTIGTVTGSSVSASWTPATPAPANGYQYFIATNMTTPSGSTTPTGTTTTASATATGLTANSTYYFWVRSNCANGVSQWVFGNSFTTLGTGSGCTNAPYGQFPTSAFTPSCFGNDELIVSNAFAGEYTLVNIQPNRQYTFKSSAISDYITITNADASVFYIAGTTPLVWSSGTNTGQIRYFIHTNSACGTQEADRERFIACQLITSSCPAPTGVTIGTITAAGATVSWTAPMPAPATGYNIYVSTSSTAPTASTTPTGTVTTISANITGLLAQTTYYVWVQGDCGSENSVWVAGGNFITLAGTNGCTTATYGLFPAATFTPTCTGTEQLIAADTWAGEYSNIAITPATPYTFRSSVNTDFITIANTDGSVVYAYGNSPLSWNSGTNTGVVRYYIHANSSCTDQNANRSRFIQCSASSVCNPPTVPNITAVTGASISLAWEAPTPAPANGYAYYVSTSSTPPTASTIPTGTSTTTSATASGLNGNTLYYAWVRSVCAGGVSTWLDLGFATTSATTNFCNTATFGLYPTAAFTPTCNGNSQTIVTDAYAGEFTVVNVVANTQYTFSSSVATDYMTITTSSGSALLSNGLTPLVWNSGTYSGTVRYYLHANASCGSQEIPRSRFIRCTASLSTDQPDKAAYAVFPNPTTDEVTISGAQPIRRIDVINSLGQVVGSGVYSDHNTVSLSLKQYPIGLYVLLIHGRDQIQTHKVVRQ